MNDFEVGAWAMVNYIYNTGGEAFADAVFPGSHPSYRAEKADQWAASPQRAMGYLDNVHRERLFVAVRQHEQAAREQLNA